MLEIADPTVLVYGPATFLRETGQPQTETVHFPFDGRGGAPYRMCILNGLPDGTKRTSSATVTLNGQTIVTQSDVNQQVGSLTRTVPLVVGENVMEVRVASVPSSRITLCVSAQDVTPPVLAIAAPAAGHITREATVAVSGTVTDQTATRVALNGAETVRAGDAWSGTAALPAQGPNTFTVHAVDAAGNATDSVRTVIRDSEAPVLTLATPAAEQALTKGDSVDVAGQVTDRTTVTLNVNGAPVAVGTDGQFATRLALAAGTNFVTVTATDQAGNAASVVRQVVQDKVAPTLILTTPASGATSRTAAYRVAGSVTDAATVTLTVNAVATPVAADGSFGGDVTLVDGPNAITVVAIDAAGNRSEATGSVMLDAAPPALAITSPAVELTVTRTATLVVSGTASDRTGAYVTVNGIPATLDGTGAFSVPVTLVEGANTITITVNDGAGNSSTVLRQIDLDTQPPALDVSAPQDGALPQGGTVSVSGTVTDAHAATVTANGSALAVAGGGSFSGSISAPADRLVTVVATDAAGNATTVTRTLGQSMPGGGSLPPDPRTVAPALNRTVATTLAGSTAFLYSGANPIQTGVAPGTITPYQAAVIRGRLITREGAPLSGVTVSVHGRPELGQTLSRADGGYDLAVNGGEVLTLSYAKPGVLPAQRQRTIPRQQWVTLEDVAMVPLDTMVTTVDLSQPAPVARGSVMTDASGSRRGTLIFDQGTQATMVLPDGTTQPLGNLAVRVTEYTVGPGGPAAMPAELPAASAYTYAAELSVDEALAAGATTVRFSKPVSVYVENFIGFPVGGIVPMGTYDRVRAMWVPDPNGRVVKVLSTAGGVATLDVDGAGTAASAARLAALGVTTAELGRVAELYQAGQSLWRIPTTHFSPKDANWPYDEEPEDMMPKEDPPTDGAGGKGKGDEQLPLCQGKRPGSIIGCDRRTLGEELPITGTSLTLTYTSERTVGYRPDFTYDVPLSDNLSDSLVALMSRILLRATIAGRTTVDTFPAQRGLHGTFIWDGRDAYGRLVQGQSRLRLEVGYVYGGLQYGAPVSDSAPSFGRGSTSELAPELRAPATLWRTVLERTIGNWQNTSAALGGWSLSTHHSFDPTTGALYTGDGERRRPASLNPTLERAATGRAYSMIIEADGSILTGYEREVVRIARDGTRTVIAGNGQLAFSGDGGPATQAGMLPANIARAPDGSLYIGDYYNKRLRRVDSLGIITTIAGNGTCGDAGDGLPASQAQFCSFDHIAFGSDGSLYVSSGANQYYPTRVRRIGPDGIVTNFAGVQGWDCDYSMCGDAFEASPAATAPLGAVNGLAVLPDGGLLIADAPFAFASVLWKVDRAGIRTRYAGKLGYADSGDGLQAREANLAGISRIAAGPDGSVYVLTQRNVVRRIARDGIITTVAGKANSDCGGAFAPVCPPSGTNALQMPLSTVYSLAVSAQNTLYIANAGQNVIFRLTKPLPDADANIGT